MSLDDSTMTGEEFEPSDSLQRMLTTVVGDLGRSVQIWPVSTPPHDVSFQVDRMAALGAEVVVVGPELTIVDALAVVRNFDERQPGVSPILVASRSTELLEQALRAGAAGILDPVAPDSEIREILAEARSRALRRREHLGIDGSLKSPNRVVPIMAAKGGVGKTTVSTNLASALALGFPREVVIVDIDVQFGDVCSNLGIEPVSTITDTIQYGDRLDATTLKAFLTPAQSDRLFVLAAPHTPMDAERLTAAHVGHVLRLLKDEFRFVIIDTSPGIDEVALEALDVASELVLLTSMDVPSVRAAAKEIAALRQLGMEHLNWHLVLNRANSKVGLSDQDIEITLGHRIDARIPSTRAIPISVNQGEPLVIAEPRSPASKVIIELANRIAGIEADRSGLLRRRSSK